MTTIEKSDGLAGGERLARRMAASDWAMLAAFTALIVFAAAHHEPWRDELDPWLRVRDADLSQALHSSLRHTGHPLLWYLMQRAVAALGLGVNALTVMHTAIAIAYGWVLVRFAPFPAALRALLLGGYFLAFEYAVIVRGYGLGVLGLFCVCALFSWLLREPARRAPLVAISAVLAMMVHVSIHTLILAAACALALLWAMPTVRTVLALAPVAGSAALSLWSMRPAPDNVWGRRVFSGLLSSGEALARHLLNALVPVLSPPPFFWDRGRLAAWLGYPLSLIALLALLIGAGAALRRARPAVALFCAGLLGLVALFCFVHPGSIRHHGHLFLIVIAACWLAHDLDPPGRRTRMLALGTVAVVHAFAAIWAIACDARQPFSNVTRAARFVQELHLSPATAVVGDVDYAVSPLAAFLPGPIHFPVNDRVGTYVDFDHTGAATNAQVLAVACNLLETTGTPPVIIMNRPLVGAVPDGFAGGGSARTPTRMLASFEGAAVSDENFWIYVLADAACPQSTP